MFNILMLVLPLASTTTLNIRVIIVVRMIITSKTGSTTTIRIPMGMLSSLCLWSKVLLVLMLLHG